MSNSLFIKTEQDRIPACIAFVTEQIDNLKRELYSLDYTEDVNGKLEYSPNYYGQEKQEINQELKQWEIMMDLLKCSVPFHKLTY